MNKKELKKFYLYYRETPYAFLKDYCATNLAWYQKIFINFAYRINSIRRKRQQNNLKKYIDKKKHK